MTSLLERQGVVFQELLDLEVLGFTIRNIARVVVFGGIALILLRKLIRRLKNPRS